MGRHRMDAYPCQVERSVRLSSCHARGKLLTTLVVFCFPLLTYILQPVAWVPLDAIGKAYLDWVLCKTELPALVNVVHPLPTTWDVILKGLHEELGGTLPIVPIHEWVKKLEERSLNPSSEDLISIVRFYFCPVETG